MATVTVLTAERMLEIYDASIVDGSVVAGHLILTTQGGDDIDAGELIEAGGDPFVGQYTTAGRPSAATSTDKIYWDLDEGSFYKSNGAVWVEAPMGGGGDVDPGDFIGQYVTLARPSAVGLDGKILFDVDEGDFYMSNDVAWSPWLSPGVQAYVDTLSIPAQVASTDTSKLDIYTVGGITYFDVTAVGGGGSGGSSFTDSDFDIHDDLDPTKILKVSLANLTESRTFIFPDGDGFVVTDNNPANLANKVLRTADGVGGGYGRFADRLFGGIAFDATAMAAGYNSYNVVGGPVQLPTLTFWHNGALTTTPTPTTVTSVTGQIAARIMRSNGTFGTSDHARIQTVAMEAPTVTAQGSDIRIAVTRLGSLTLENILNIQGGADASTGGTVSVRNQLIVGMGDATTRPAAGYAAEFRHATNAFGYGTGAGTTALQTTSKATATPAVSTPNGLITTHAASLAAGTVVSFVLTHAGITANDHLIVDHVAGGTVGAYTVIGVAGAGFGTIYIRNNTAGALAETLQLRYLLIRGTVT